MAAKPKIPKPQRGAKPLRDVVIRRPSEDGCMRFSFKHAQVPGQDPFLIPACEAQEKSHKCKHSYFVELFRRLRDVCQMPESEFRNKYSKALRNHQVKFGKDDRLTSKGFDCLSEGLREQADPAAFQFSVDTHRFGRVIGFLIEDIFFVVWFDPDHQMYG